MTRYVAPARPPRTIDAGQTAGWWRDTPWKDIQRQVKAALSKREYTEWLQRPDVQDRAGHIEERCGF